MTDIDSKAYRTKTGNLATSGYVLFSRRVYTSDGVRYYFSHTFIPTQPLTELDVEHAIDQLDRQFLALRQRPTADVELKDKANPPLSRYFLKTGPNEHTQLLPNTVDLLGTLKCDDDGWCEALKVCV